MNRLIICVTLSMFLKGLLSEPSLVDDEIYGQTCASCSGVETSSECEHNTRCDPNEVCSVHYYVTESGKSLFDYGCAVPQICLQSIGSIFGRRSEGHHVKCVKCCNETISCNRNLTCSQNSLQNSSFPRECSDIKGISKSGVYTIYPFGQPTPLVFVFCEVDGKGNVWTDIQRRIDGTVDFYRNWTEYKNGFGSPQGEYWIGNDIIHQLTSNGNHRLQIIMTEFSNVMYHANYDSFSVSNETNGYTLSLGSYSGNAGDSLTRHNGQKFSTADRSNDPSGGWNCAKHYHGAWWYAACHNSNLNGKYSLTADCPYGTGIIWRTIHNSYYYCLKSTTMMIRRG